MADEDGDIATWRAVVDQAHRDVQVGAYPQATAAFAKAHEALARLLGADHPEVEELALDLQTVAEMAGVAALHAELGRQRGDLDLPTLPSEGEA